MNEIRVRFAPSPTGQLHIGGARTALFNWLFARHGGGKLVLRVEDTDLERSTAEAAAGIIDGLQWLGIDWDEGPYYQSERLPVYQEHISRLLDEGKAYYCFCTPEELAMEREKAVQEGRTYRYSGRCRDIPLAEAKRRIAAGEKAVVRLKVDPCGQTVVHDLVRGDVTFDNEIIDDIIICKSDGWPTYNFAVVVDDSTMGITHVIRAEEHLSNTPKQLMVYMALGLNPPAFAHVSMILAPDRSKLSKRHGATSVQEFRDQGFLPEALVNYLVLLGFTPSEGQDIFALPEAVEAFDLSRVSRSPAIYDIEKLTWMNGQYLASTDADRIVRLLAPRAEQLGYLDGSEARYEYFTRVVSLVRSRAKLLPEVLEAASYFYDSEFAYDEKGVAKHFRKEGAGERLRAVRDMLAGQDDFTAAGLEASIRELADRMGIKAADLIHPVRLALSGRTATPGLFEVMELLGRPACLGRLDRAIAFVDGKN